jgi:hypothetical protein
MGKFFVAACVVMGVLLSACGSAKPGAAEPERHGTLTGFVVTGPVCPVLHAPPRSACRPRPVQGAHVDIRTRGHSVAATDTDRGGRFVVELPYGKYVVTATNPSPLGTTAQQRVELGARPTKVRLLVDSGIR